MGNRQDESGPRNRGVDVEAKGSRFGLGFRAVGPSLRHVLGQNSSLRELLATFEEAILGAANRCLGSSVLNAAAVRVHQLLDAEAHGVAGPTNDPEWLTELRRWPSSSLFGARERAAIELAEQYLIDPGSVTDEQRAAVVSFASRRGVVLLTLALALIENSSRVETMLRDGFRVEPVSVAPFAIRNPAPSEDDAVPDGGGVTGRRVLDLMKEHAPQAERAYEQMRAILWGPQAHVRPAILELVRMRNAGLVDCKLCRAVRYVPAIDDGLTEERLALVNDSWDQATLSECEKAALYLADACLVDPAIMSQGVRNRVLACFTEQQIAEIVLLLVLVRFNKVTLAFGGNADVSGVLLVTQSSVKERADDL